VVGRSARTAILVGLLALAGLGACGGNDTETPAGATVPKATSSTTPADLYAVPATIDAAYLNKVFAALEHVDGDATRAVVASKNFVPDAANRLRAIYAEDEFQEQVNLWLDVIIEKRLNRLKPSPGDRSSVTAKVHTAAPECIFVAVMRDYSPVAIAPGPPDLEYVTLRPIDPQRDPLDLNPTPWMIESAGLRSDGSVPSNPCA
jgi:hypothetical protein